MRKYRRCFVTHAPAGELYLAVFTPWRLNSTKSICANCRIVVYPSCAIVATRNSPRVGTPKMVDLTGRCGTCADISAASNRARVVVAQCASVDISRARVMTAEIAGRVCGSSAVSNHQTSVHPHALIESSQVRSLLCCPLAARPLRALR